MAVSAAHRARDHRLVGVLHQVPATARSPQAALAWSRPLRLLVPLGLLARRRRQAGVVRRLRRNPKPGFQLRHARCQSLHLRPQRPDQGVLLIMQQVAEVGKLGHPQLESQPPWSRQQARSARPFHRSGGDEQIFIIRLLLGLNALIARSWTLSWCIYRVHGMRLIGPPEERIWYFAYGANMHDSAFREWRGMRPFEWRVGRVRGYRLRFNLQGGQRGGAAPANLHADPQAEVWGVLYAITRRDLVRLD